MLKSTDSPEQQEQINPVDTSLSTTAPSMQKYLIRSYTIALTTFPPLIVCILLLYFQPPSSIKEGALFIVASIAIWIPILANLLQITGFTLREIWTIADLDTRYRDNLSKAAIIATATFLSTVVVILSIELIKSVHQSRSIPSETITILVAEFSEGAGLIIPQDRSITHEILAGLEKLEKRDSNLDIVPLHQVIIDQNTALTLGKEKGASAIIWGVYTKNPKHVLVEPHLTLVSPSTTVYSQGHLTEPKQRTVDINDLFTFNLHFDLQQEFIYLSSFVAGIAHYSEGRLEEALTYLDAALEHARDSDSLGVESIYYYKGLILRLQGKFSEAEEEYHNAIKAQPNFVDAYNALGLTYADQGKTAEAVSQYLKAIAIEPEFASGYNNLAIAYETLKRPSEEIVKYYSRAIEIQPNATIYRQNLGIHLQETGKYDEALSQYQVAIQLDANNADNYYLLGTLYHDIGNWKEAENAFAKALELEPNHVAVHNALGVLYSEIGESRKAIREYETALKLNPALSIAYYNLGLQHEFLWRYGQALSNYKVAVTLEPEKPLYLCSLAKLHLRRKQLDQGLPLLTLCKALAAANPDDASTYNVLALIYMQQKEYRAAILELEHALQVQPDSYIYRLNLSQAYAQNGELLQAINQANLSLRYNPIPYIAHFQLIQLYLRVGDYREVLQESILVLSKTSISTKILFAFTITVLITTFYILIIFRKQRQREAILSKVLLTSLELAVYLFSLLQKGLVKVISLLEGKLNASSIHLVRFKCILFLSRLNYSLAIAYLMNNKNEQARNTLRSVLSIHPNHLDSGHLLLNLYISDRDLTNAFRTAYEAVYNNPDDVVMKIRLGDLLFNGGAIKDAIKQWEDAINTNADTVISFRMANMNPLYIPNHFSLGLAFRVKKDFAKALVGFNVTIDSSSSPILLKESARQNIQIISLQSQ